MLDLVGIQPPAHPVIPLIAPLVHRMVRGVAPAPAVAAVMLGAQDQMRAAGDPGCADAVKPRRPRLHVGADHSAAPSPLTSIAQAAGSMKCSAASRWASRLVLVRCHWPSG